MAKKLKRISKGMSKTQFAFQSLVGELGFKELVLEAIACLGNENPGLDIQRIGWCACLHAISQINQNQIQSLAYELICDNGVEPVAAKFLAGLILGLEDTHKNWRSILRYVRTGAKRPMVDPRFLALAPDDRTPHQLRQMLKKAA